MKQDVNRHVRQRSKERNNNDDEDLLMSPIHNITRSKSVARIAYRTASQQTI